MCEDTEDLKLYKHTLCTYKKFIEYVSTVDNAYDFNQLQYMASEIQLTLLDIIDTLNDFCSDTSQTTECTDCNSCKLDRLVQSFKLNLEKIINLEKFEHLKVIKSFLTTDLRTIDLLINQGGEVSC